MSTKQGLWIALVAGLASAPGAAGAQTAASGSSAEQEPLNGLTAGTSGRVGDASFPDPGAIPGGPIPANRPELSVTAAMARVVLPEPLGDFEASVLDGEIADRFASLAHCRTDVARRNGISPGAVAAETLTLRWTIVEKGEVAGMEVVGSTPVDADVLDCVKRDTKAWSFTALPGGDLKLNRILVFRALPAAPPQP